MAMAITGAAGLLAAWEAGLAAPPAGRALLLHRTARPDLDDRTLPELPVGEREADLFALRRTLFGERMQVRMDCAECGADMEFELDAGEFARTPGERPDPVVRVEHGGWRVAFRLPAVADLTAAARTPDPRAALLARCLVTAEHDGQAVT
ncbi:T4 family baseplate hub assembly chaperone, partial [Streptomyces pharetrae]